MGLLSSLYLSLYVFVIFIVIADVILFTMMYRVVFLTGLPNFSTKKKTANQPTTAAVPENPVTKKGRD